MKWFAEYLDSAENRRKLTLRLGIFITVGGTLVSIFLLYALIFLKN
ncbi:hypothetical protein [Pseudoduganella sp. UC29_71]